MLTLTKNAVKRFKAMLKQSPNGTHGVHIYAEAGC
jgi:Fe-S cluster assembly iron-binding protein IscA